MRKFAKRWMFGCAIFTAIYFAPIGRAEIIAPPTQSQQIESLRLPSFSIFGLDEAKGDPKWNVQYPEEELQKMLGKAIEIGKEHGTYSKKTENRISFLIPRVMFRSRHLYAQSSWSASDLEEGQLISRFFAHLMNQPELEIHSSQQAAFRDGLVNLRNWYVDLCRRNSTLSRMVTYSNYGPYFGFPLPRERFSSLRVLQSVGITGGSEKFALMTDGKKTEPFFIGVLAPNGTIKWATRFSKSPDGTIQYAELSFGSCSTVQDIGYKCNAFVGEISDIYLDENLNLRFYFVSW